MTGSWCGTSPACRSTPASSSAWLPGRASFTPGSSDPPPGRRSACTSRRRLEGSSRRDASTTRSSSRGHCRPTGAGSSSSFLGVSNLAERLGYAPDAKLLVINCDDLGSTRSANVGVYDALRNGVATSASLMVPCPWARDAAAQHRGEDVGVHLTLNSEWETYRWGPITHSASLLDGDGGFPRTVEDTWEHADLDEVRRECRAQIERAIMWGFDVSHLDSHMGTLQM